MQPVVRVTLIVLVAGLTQVSAGPARPYSMPSRTSHVADGEQHLPDLRTVRPSQPRLDIDDGIRLLRFTNAIWNSGDGPLEVHPQHDEENGTTSAVQWIFTHDESGWIVIDRRDAGTFEFHLDHDHWHFANLADYRLYPLRGGAAGNQVVAQSDKVGFCMFDEFQRGAELEHAGEQHYHGHHCDQNFVQGYTVGWGDTYRNDFPGQFIDVTGVENGRYLLYSEADPSDLLAETDDNNNASSLRVAVTEDSVRTVPRTRVRVCRPCGRTRLVAGKRYTMRGRTSFTDDGQTITLYYKRRSGRWIRLGSPRSAAFRPLFEDGSLSNGDDGRWRARFKPLKPGRWRMRATMSATDEATSSSDRMTLRVEKR